MAAIKSFRELNVYQMAGEQAYVIFKASRSFPPEEKYSLTDQIRRSSRAVNALLAEAWARRRYEAAFVNKVNEALGEAMETQSWLDHALLCEYITRKQFLEFDGAWQHIGGKLNRMIETSAEFCQSARRGSAGAAA